MTADKSAQAVNAWDCPWLIPLYAASSAPSAQREQVRSSWATGYWLTVVVAVAVGAPLLRQHFTGVFRMELQVCQDVRCAG